MIVLNFVLMERNIKILTRQHKKVGTKKTLFFLRNNLLTQLFLSYLLPFKEYHLKILNPLIYPKCRPHVHNPKGGDPTL